nr:hypothetical protein [uncultured Sphingomonas sp.]
MPKYNHAGLYEGVDETSFRGAFLDECGDVLSKELMLEAWDNRFPEAAIEYGRDLLAAAEQAAAHPPSHRRGLFGFGGRSKSPSSTPFEDQLDIAQSAGKWFLFWGERGNAIRAWF